MEILKIDGRHGEGGGQILRTSMSLAAIVGQSICMTNIRSKRATGGLQPQHLAACRAVAEVSQGSLSGAEKDSQALVFHPKKIAGGHYSFDIGTAGTTILVAQTIIPILLHAAEPSIVHIRGGTHLPHSPSYDYFDNVFLPAIRRFGANLEAKMLQPGYYPAGGGSIEISIKPSQLTGNMHWEQNDLSHAIIRLSKLPKERHIGRREAEVLSQHAVKDISIIDEQAISPANALTLWCGFRGACHLGERGKLAEKVAEELWMAFQSENAQVDCHLADQLLLYACLAQGPTTYTTSLLTSHLETNADIIRRFLDRQLTLSGSYIQID